MNHSPQAETVRKALESLGGKAHIRDIFKMLASTIPTPESSIRRTLQEYCKACGAFEQGNDELFFSVYGLNARKGVWGLIGFETNKENNDHDAPLPAGHEEVTYYPKIRDSKVSGPIGYGIKEKEEDNDQDYLIPPDRREVKSYPKIRKSRIVLRVKEAKKYECEICFKAPELPNSRKIVHGHHMQPLGAEHEGHDVIENILVVCPNCHVLCDQFAILLPDSLADPSMPKYETRLKYIQYHNEQYERKQWGSKQDQQA